MFFKYGLRDDEVNRLVGFVYGGQFSAREIWALEGVPPSGIFIREHNPYLPKEIWFEECHGKLRTNKTTGRLGLNLEPPVYQF